MRSGYITKLVVIIRYLNAKQSNWSDIYLLKCDRHKKKRPVPLSHYKTATAERAVIQKQQKKKVLFIYLDNATKFKKGVDKLTQNVNTRTKQGLVLLIPMVLIPTLPLMPGAIADLLGVIMAICGTTGLIWALYWGRGGRRLLHGIEVIQQLSPPFPVLGARYAFVVENSIYIFATWDSSALLFVRVLDQHPAHEQKMQLLEPIWTWKYNKQIEGISIARKEGIVCIPDGRRNYISGSGIIYALPVERGFFVQHKYPIDKNVLVRVSRVLLLDLLE
jgi:hypothetical protein